MMKLRTMRWTGESLLLLDQTLLPGRVEYVSITTCAQMTEAIATMQVRGAPAIGVAAAYGMVMAAREAAKEGDFMAALVRRGELLRAARPTAVNLMWAVERMLARAGEMEGPERICAALEAEANAIYAEDGAINRALGENLLSLLKEGDGVLTHCNAGALAATEYGTALAPFYLAAERGFPLRIYADETRPRLQGARLTAFELHQAGLPVTLLCDSMAAVLMAQGKINAVITGCDRVAANGDTANKIGTFSLSIVAKHFSVPLYIAAPSPTIDLNCPDGASIPIEERDPEEVALINGERITADGVAIFNPSFDVTPASHIAAIVTEKGIARPPYGRGIRELLRT